MKMDNIGIVLWSTYYGEAGEDHLSGLAVDNNDNIILSGHTLGTGLVSPDFPTPDNNPIDVWAPSMIFAFPIWQVRSFMKASHFRKELLSKLGIGAEVFILFSAR